MSQIENVEAMLVRGQDSEVIRFALGCAYLAKSNVELAVLHLSQAVQMKPDYLLRGKARACTGS